MSNQIALSRAIDLTDEILLVLEEKDFLRLAELEAKREPLIRQAFTASMERVDSIKAIHLKNLNQQVVEKLEELKQSIVSQQNQLRRAAKANSAYQTNLA